MKFPDSAAACRRGAFYAFPNVSATGVPSKELADLLLYEAGCRFAWTATASELMAMGTCGFSYANSLENIQEALNRIRKASARWAK